MILFAFLDMGSISLQIFYLHGALIRSMSQTSHMLRVLFLNKVTFHQLTTWGILDRLAVEDIISSPYSDHQ